MVANKAKVLNRIVDITSYADILSHHPAFANQLIIGLTPKLECGTALSIRYRGVELAGIEQPYSL